MTLEAIENRVTQLESMSKSSSILQSAEALAQKGAILCFIGRSEEAVVALGRSLTLTKYSNREQREQRNSTMHALRETLVSCEKSDDRWKVEQDVYSKVAQDIRQAIQAGLDEDFEKCISLWTDLLSQHSPQTLKSSGQRVENIERILDIAVRGSQKTQKNLDMLFQGGGITKIGTKSLQRKRAERERLEPFDAVDREIAEKKRQAFARDRAKQEKEADEEAERFVDGYFGAASRAKSSGSSK